MRLIDADALKDWAEIVPLTGDGGIDINDFDEKLKSMPTVDAVPVIRCKDCKNSDPWYADERRCFLWSENGISVFDDGFCNYAERKEE